MSHPRNRNTRNRGKPASSPYQRPGGFPHTTPGLSQQASLLNILVAQPANEPSTPCQTPAPIAVDTTLSPEPPPSTPEHLHIGIGILHRFTIQGREDVAKVRDEPTKVSHVTIPIFNFFCHLQGAIISNQSIFSTEEFHEELVSICEVLHDLHDTISDCFHSPPVVLPPATPTPDPQPAPSVNTDAILLAVADLKTSLETCFSNLGSQPTPPSAPLPPSNSGSKTYANVARTPAQPRHSLPQKPKSKQAKAQTKATPYSPKPPEPVRYVVRFCGSPPSPELRISPIQVLSHLNALLSGNPLASGIGFVGSQWNKAGNLILTFTPGSPLVSIDHLIPEIRKVLGLEVDTLITCDKVWSRLLVSSVPARSSPSDPVYSNDSILESLISNPDCKGLVITRQPRWVRKPELIKSASSFAFSFQDPDGSLARRLLKTSIFVFGTPVTIKRWVDKPCTRNSSPRLNKESGALASHEPMEH